MSGSLARKMRRRQLVRATSRDDVLMATANRVIQLENVVGEIIQVLRQRGILAEAKTESGIIVPGGSVT